jgi:hypothetical protein
MLELVSLYLETAEIPALSSALLAATFTNLRHRVSLFLQAGGTQLQL